jgi:tRNA dimethylallyltransferase
MKPKVLVILGPTATGKSGMAVSLARKFSGEIISADSRQVYSRLNLGTGKITKGEMRGVPHYLLDAVDPKKQFSVADYKILANKALKKILTKGKLPIIVGGTGFYIDSLIFNTNLPEVPPNKSLRKRLEKKTAQELFMILKKKDPRRAKTIDQKNKVRLIRALEIVSALGHVPKVIKEPPFQALFIGLNLPDKILRNKIHKRLSQRIKKGMITEVRKLHNSGVSWQRLENLGLEYKWVALYLQNKITKGEMLTKLESAIWQYSRRQMTWFRKNKKIEWFDAGKKNFKRDIVKSLTKFLI